MNTFAETEIGQRRKNGLVHSLPKERTSLFLYPETAIFRAAVRSALMTCVNIIDENQLFLADSLDNLLKIGTMLYEQVHKMERDVENV